MRGVASYPDPGDVIPARSISSERSITGDPDIDVVSGLLARLRLRPPVRLIDVGAGTGRLAPAYLPFVDEAVLVEPDSVRFERARARLRSVPGVELIYGLAHELVPTRKRFDIVLCSHVLQHLSSVDRAKLIHVLRELTDDAGLILLLAPCSTERRPRFLVSTLDSDQNVSTAEVGSELFDRIAAAPAQIGVLPVWQGAIGDLEELTKRGGCRVLESRLYHRFSFEAGTVQQTAANGYVLAHPVVR
jgi:SAM-dependent methyltransferase